MSLKDPLWLVENARFRLTASPVVYHCEPIWSWKAESLPDFTIWGVLEGSGELSLNGQDSPLSPGVCFLFQPGDAIDAKQNPLNPLSIFVTRFEILDTDNETISAEELNLPRGALRPMAPRNLENLANLSLSWNAENPTQKAIQDHALRMFLLFIADASHTAFDKRALKALNALESDCSRKWTVEELSKIAGLSTSQFSRVFLRLTGESPIRHLITLRMKEAKKLMLETSLSIEEIAERIGYTNVNFFEQQFIHRIGQDPESLRRHRAI